MPGTESTGMYRDSNLQGESSRLTSPPKIKPRKGVTLLSSLRDAPPTPSPLKQCPLPPPLPTEVDVGAHAATRTAVSSLFSLSKCTAGILLEGARLQASSWFPGGRCTPNSVSQGHEH